MLYPFAGCTPEVGETRKLEEPRKMKMVRFPGMVLRWTGIALLVMLSLAATAVAQDLASAKPETVGLSPERLERMRPDIARLVTALSLRGWREPSV